VVKEIPKYHIEKVKIKVKSEKIHTILKNLKEKYKNYPLNELDGVRIKTKDGFAHIRASNTEPVVRIIVEDKKKEKVKKLLKEIIKEITK
jgi:phosphomannomutase